MIVTTTAEINSIDPSGKVDLRYASPKKSDRSNMVTPPKAENGIYLPSALNGSSKTTATATATTTSTTTTTSNDCRTTPSTTAETTPSSLPSTVGVVAPSKNRRPVVVYRLLKYLLWNGPLLCCWCLCLVSSFATELWEGPLERLLASFYRPDDHMTDLGLYASLDHELTYYHRRCDHRDISTRDANDLLIDPNMTLKERQDVVMTHGAVVMKDIIGHDTAVELRRYLEVKHHKFHTTDLKLPWDELFWDGDGGSRLSLGLGPEDASIVGRAIAEAGSNSELKRTLEATLGKDPAVVEVSTLSTMFDAEAQGIHTDSDFFSSSVLYTRSFLHSYTMFISLQDTTSRMGATTICPGTHWCADEDLENLCQCNYLDEDFHQVEPIGYCNTFEASSNGQTGLDVGVLQRGDAMMFNQNIWHRGPRNYDLQRQENRAMFIMTFVSRRDFEKGDNRQQGWGTFYYMRHSMWGHLFSDLKTAASGGMDLFTKRLWKAYGIFDSSRAGNLPWLEHWARMMSNEMDFFGHSDVVDFHFMLEEVFEKNILVKWLFAPQWELLQEENHYGDEDFEDSEDDTVDWKGYLEAMLQGANHQSQRLYLTVAVATILANGVGYALHCLFWWVLTSSSSSTRKGTNGNKSSSSMSMTEAPQPTRDLSRTLGGMVVGHLLVLGIAMAARHYVLYRAPLFERIHTGDINFEAFPPLPVETVEDTVYDEDGEAIGTDTFYQEISHVELIAIKQEIEQFDFILEHPKHPYSDYYRWELERLQRDHRPTNSDYLIPQLQLPVDPSLPIQASAFPERNDVLIGSRFDADYLASMNFVLDFHPGTKKWIELMKEHQDTISFISKNSENEEAYVDMVVDTIAWKILGPPTSLLSQEGGTPRRFLKQDHQTGWWIVMTQTEAKAITKQTLLVLARPLSVGVAVEHWKQVLAESRFGKRRHTALAKKWIPQTVDRRMTELVNTALREQRRTASPTNPGSKQDGPNETNLVSPMASATMAKRGIGTDGLRGRTTILPPSTGRGLLPKSVVTGKTALSPCNVLWLPPPAFSTRAYLKEMSKNVVTLNMGDHILYKGDDNQPVFFQATIESIYAEEDRLEIRPLRSEDVDEEFDEVTMFVDLSDVQYFRPASEGDIVWSLTVDPDGERNTWKKYEVLFLTPFGSVELLMTDEYAEKFGGDDEDEFDEEEPFENRSFPLDYKRFMLTDDRLPEIRLRQYG